MGGLAGLTFSPSDDLPSRAFHSSARLTKDRRPQSARNASRRRITFRCNLDSCFHCRQQERRLGPLLSS